MNTKTKRLEPRLRLLISGRFFPNETRLLQSLGWPAHIAPVADQAAPHGEAMWLRSLETAALHADAIVCLLVNDTAHYPNPPHAQRPTTVAAPDWPSRLLETVSEWRRQWHSEPLIFRCISVASLAQAGALAQRLSAPNPSASLPVGPLDTRLHLVLQSCHVNGLWHLRSPLPWWQHREPLADRARIRAGHGIDCPHRQFAQALNHPR